LALDGLGLRGLADFGCTFGEAGSEIVKQAATGGN